MQRLLTLCLTLMVFAAGIPSGPAYAGKRCFSDVPAVTACFDDPFSTYWQANGALAVFGYPLSNAAQERNPDLKVNLLTQWTERNRLEVHPENQPPFDILLGRMGAERLQQIGHDPAQEGPEPGARDGCLWFEETGHNVCDMVPGKGFKSYWQSHGLKIAGLDDYGRSLQLFGLPLTSPRLETNATGDTVLTQWFERARFEWHPNNPDEFKVLLGLLGGELRTNPAAQRPASIFGVEINRNAVPAVAARAGEASVSWARYNGILWPEVEARRGVRDWSKLARVEDELRALSVRGLTPVVIVRGAPAWAQKVAGSICGPIKADALGAFADFMRDLVTRYSVPPFNVKYWELGNEPDVDPSIVQGDSPFGCWGDENDQYYGGGYYADMLKQVYPTVKQANHNAQIVVGGLLLDCDPTNPPSGKSCKSSQFFEGILRNGGGAFYDIVGYHAYNYWSVQQTDKDLGHPNWKARGGAMLGKLDFIRSVQGRYGVHKPVLMDEGGLLCYPGVPSCPGDAYFAAQASYAARMYTRAWANGLLGAAWYTLNGPGWRDGGMLNSGQTPRPAYVTLKFMSNLLKDAVYSGRVSQNQVEGYAFGDGATTYQVYWTNDATPRTIAAPAGTRAIYNTSGQQVASNGNSLRIGFDPIIVEIRTR